MMKSVFYFMLKALFVLEIFTFLSLLFGFVEKRLDNNNNNNNNNSDNKSFFNVGYIITYTEKLT